MKNYEEIKERMLFNIEAMDEPDHMEWYKAAESCAQEAIKLVIEELELLSAVLLKGSHSYIVIQDRISHYKAMLK